MCLWLTLPVCLCPEQPKGFIDIFSRRAKIRTKFFSKENFPLDGQTSREEWSPQSFNLQCSHTITVGHFLWYKQIFSYFSLKNQLHRTKFVNMNYNHLLGLLFRNLPLTTPQFKTPDKITIILTKSSTSLKMCTAGSEFNILVMGSVLEKNLKSALRTSISQIMLFLVKS